MNSFDLLVQESEVFPVSLAFCFPGLYCVDFFDVFLVLRLSLRLHGAVSPRMSRKYSNKRRN